jgi:hypothetical protein
MPPLPPRHPDPAAAAAPRGGVRGRVLACPGPGKDAALKVGAADGFRVGARDGDGVDVPGPPAWTRVAIRGVLNHDANPAAFDADAGLRAPPPSRRAPAAGRAQVFRMNVPARSSE